jgi:hypothetical protein
VPFIATLASKHICINLFFIIAHFCMFFECSQKHQARLLPYLLAPPSLLQSAAPVQLDDWLLHSQVVLQFVLDPSQHVEALAADERARAHATMLMKCSLNQLTPQVLLGFNCTISSTRCHVNSSFSGFVLCPRAVARVIAF